MREIALTNIEIQISNQWLEGLYHSIKHLEEKKQKTKEKQKNKTM